jgi:hypothetical protein
MAIAAATMTAISVASTAKKMRMLTGTEKRGFSSNGLERGAGLVTCDLREGGIDPIAVTPMLCC